MLARILTDKRNDIVSLFVAEVKREDLSPSGISNSLLVDHIPKFLDEVVAELATVTVIGRSQDAIDTSATAREHGEQRWDLGYDLGALIREYGILRHCIFQIVKQQGDRPSLDELDVLAKCLSVGVAEAATAYIEHRDRLVADQQGRQAFLAEAGDILSSSLDYRSTLGKLTRLLVPGYADWCAVHIEGVGVDEIPIVHVDPIKGDIVRDIYRRIPASPDAPHIRRTGKAQLLTHIEPTFFETIAESAEHLALLREVNTCSWLIVPLEVQGHVFGAITLAYSDSGRHYQTSDLVLAEDLANKAAIAIDNARLYDLSQQERSRAEAATRAKDEFVAMLSHELRTPLNAILGWLRLMRDGSLDASRREHALDVIERNANAQNRLVLDLLDISGVMTGKVRINPSQVDLADVVEMAIEGIRPAADAKRIEISAELGLGDSVMRADGARLEQVTWNLLANAVKFTPKGGKVVVRLRRVASDLELVVEDSGEGITESFLPHVFESFRQSDTSVTRPHGGLGIGLSIARHLVELHGGTITAESAGSGRGATFRVRLPVSPLISSTLGVSRVPALSTPSPSRPMVAGLEGVRVLVVDDELDARDLVSFVLESCGVDVRSAGSKSEALDVLATYTPHVIISDVGMPNEDGYALIRSIRTHPAVAKRAIPAIALTASSQNDDRTRALVEGFNVHMVKPVEPRALARAVADLAGSPRAGS